MAHATTKQLSYIDKLAKERAVGNGMTTSEMIRSLTPTIDQKWPTISEASKAIEILLAMPKIQNPKATAALIDLDNLEEEEEEVIPIASVSNLYPSSQTTLDESFSHAIILQQLRDEISQTQNGLEAALIQTNFLNNAIAQVTNETKSLLSPQNLEPLIKSITEKTLKGVAESIILTSLGRNHNTETLEPEPELTDSEGRPLGRPVNCQQITQNQALPTIDQNFYFDPQAARAILSALKLGKNFYIQGHTGCGKTQLIMQIHAKLGRQITRVNMDGDVTKRDFIGNMNLTKDPEGNTITTYTYGALPRAMLDGHTLLLDEFDKTPAHIAAVLHPGMESHNATLYLPDTGETITAQKGFLIAATANTGGKGDAQGQYTGAEVQNAASLDRFGVMIRMDYPPNVEEIKILTAKFPNQNPSVIATLVNFATHIRGAFARQELAATLSTRKLIDLLDLMADGFTLTEALGFTFTNWLDDDDKQLAATFTDRLNLTGDEK